MPRWELSILATGGRMGPAEGLKGRVRKVPDDGVVPLSVVRGPALGPVGLGQDAGRKRARFD